MFAGVEANADIPRRKSREGTKRKLTVEGDYDPSSPTSEQEDEEHPSKKAALADEASPKKDNEVCYLLVLNALTELPLKCATAINMS